MDLKVIAFPDRDIADIPRSLRELANNIEAGKFDDAHNLAYVVDGGDGKIHIGLIGQSAEPGTLAYYLFGLGQRKLENV